MLTKKMQFYRMNKKETKGKNERKISGGNKR